MGWDGIYCGYGVAPALRIIIVGMDKSGDSATNNFNHRTSGCWSHLSTFCILSLFLQGFVFFIGMVNITTVVNGPELQGFI